MRIRALFSMSDHRLLQPLQPITTDNANKDWPTPLSLDNFIAAITTYGMLRRITKIIQLRCNLGAESKAWKTYRSYLQGKKVIAYYGENDIREGEVARCFFNKKNKDHAYYRVDFRRKDGVVYFQFPFDEFQILSMWDERNDTSKRKR